MPDADRLGMGNPGFVWAYYIEISRLPAARLYVASVTAPSLTWEVTEVDYFATKRKLASKGNVAEMTVVIRDYVDADVHNQVKGWFEAVGNLKEGTINPPSAYKSDATLEFCDSSGAAVAAWKLEGCWPSSAEFGDLDYSGTDLRQINVTITVDTIS